MAKKKELVEEIRVEETVLESTEEKAMPEADFAEKFIIAQLKAINKLNDRAKAGRLAARVLRNRKG